MPIESCRTRWAPCALAALTACAAPAPAPSVPARDAGTPTASDGGLIAVFPDGGPGPDAAPGRDAAAPFDGAVDAAAPALPRIDGVIDEGEWSAAVVTRSMTPPADSRPGDTLRALSAIRTAERLYLAIEGTIASGDAMLVFVDRDFGTGRGAVLAGMPFADPTGALDRAMSVPLVSALSELRPDAAWGTLRMPTAAPTSGDDATGWRDVATEPSDFIALEGGSTISACTATACETSIGLGRGGLGAVEELAVFARIGNGLSSLSNQSLPSDDPSSVSVLLRVPGPGTRSARVW